MASSKALYTNNASTTLLAPITAIATSFSVAAGKGALFPNPTGSEYFYVTLSDAASGTVIEICKCTARSTDTFTVTRAQQGTTGYAWLAGDKVELRPTATGFAELAALGGDNTFTGYQALAAGAVGTPSLYLSTDTTTGLYRIGANNYGFAVSGAKVLDISSAGLGVTGTLSATGLISPAQTVGIVGTTTNNSVQAGSVGEYVESVVASTTSGYTSGSTVNVTSISLTAGDWGCFWDCGICKLGCATYKQYCASKHFNNVRNARFKCKQQNRNFIA